MKTLALLTLLVLSCTTTGTPTPVPPVVGVMADCAQESVREVAKDRLTEAEQFIVSNDWQAKLTNLAKDIGVEALACIIDYIVNESKLDKMASADKNAALKNSRGELWLKENNVSFKAN